MKNIILVLTYLFALCQLHASKGQEVYTTCAICHQAEGQGIPGVFPPLAESEWVNGPIENLIRIQLRGLSGPIHVKGVQYSSAMAPVSHLSDENIADVLTYIRSSFGNKSSAVTAEQVKALRSEAGKPMLTTADLIDPNSEEGKAITAKENGAEEATEAAGEDSTSTPTKNATESAPTTGKVIQPKPMAGPNYLVLGTISVWALICIIPVIIGIARR